MVSLSLNSGIKLRSHPPEEPPLGLLELSAREGEVLRLVATGANNQEIAEAFFLPEGTIRNHISNILQRLDARDRTQAAIIAKSFPTYLEDPTSPDQKGKDY
jgi:DNA-binding NarL/FixJ family response regulator